MRPRRSARTTLLNRSPAGCAASRVAAASDVTGYVNEAARGQVSAGGFFRLGGMSPGPATPPPAADGAAPGQPAQGEAARLGGGRSQLEGDAVVGLVGR